MSAAPVQKREKTGAGSSISINGVRVRSRRTAGWVFAVAAVFATALVAAVPVANIALAVLLCIAILWFDARLNLCGSEHDEPAVPEAKGSDAPPLLADSEPPLADSEPPPAARRLPFLDNLKTALTALVVVHHATNAFTGSGSLGLSMGHFRNPFALAGGLFSAMNQAYFMALFFFVSGYFTPRSFARKGAVRFFRERLRRLGRPFLAYLFCFGPALNAIAELSRHPPGTGQYGWTYFPDAGPTWFVGWLLIFDGCYAVVADASPPGHLSRPLPGLGWLCGLGAALGLVQAAQMAATSSLVTMPITFGALPFDAVFFAGGVAAWHGRWFDAGVGGMPAVAPAVRGKARAAVVVLATLLIGGGVAVYSTGTQIKSLPSNACGTDPWAQGGGGGGGGGVLQVALVVAGMGIVLGVFAMAVSWCLLDAFQQHLNAEQGPRMRELARAAYAVYLSHPYVVVPLTMLTISAMRASGVSALHYVKGKQDSTSCMSNNGFLWLGCIVVCALSLLLAFPFGAAIRRLPVLREVL